RTATYVLFFQAEDGIRDWSVTGVQTCALPIWPLHPRALAKPRRGRDFAAPSVPEHHRVHDAAGREGEEAGDHQGAGKDSDHGVRSEERRVGKECRARW